MNPQIYAKSEDSTINPWISQCKSEDFTGFCGFHRFMKYEDLYEDQTGYLYEDLYQKI